MFLKLHVVQYVHDVKKRKGQITEKKQPIKDTYFGGHFFGSIYAQIST